MRKFMVYAMVTVLLFGFGSSVSHSAALEPFSDVPESHWSYDVVHELRDLGITNGIGDGLFGLGRTITRAEFVTFLVRLRQWELADPETGSFQDVLPESWYYSFVETAASHGVLGTAFEGSRFRPTDNITRKEMAVMIINTLGYEQLAKEKNNDASPFEDVKDHVGYIELLADFGIVNGIGGRLFAPDATAKREEAAAILIRMHAKFNMVTEDVTAFYAVSSYSQSDLMGSFDRIGFGWSKLEYFPEEDRIGVTLVMPEGYEEPLDLAEEGGSLKYLNIYADDTAHVGETGKGIIEMALTDQERMVSLQNDIALMMANDAFDGVVIDFEGMISEELKSSLTGFVENLTSLMRSSDKGLMVAVQPNLYYKAYDYGSLAEAADKLILMAHDFNAKKLTAEQMASGYTYTPVAPIGQVYDALAGIFSGEDAVVDKSKVALQISFASAQWGVDSTGSVVNDKPYTPGYDLIYNRLIQDGTSIVFDPASQSPYATYYNASSNLDYIIWYEDARSVAAKMQLANMFGVSSFSYWRLGNLPDYNDEAGKAVYLNVF